MNLTDELRVLEQKNNQDATKRQTRVLEDAASLQLTEQVLSGVERLQLKIVPKPFDAINVRVAMAEMKEAISGNQSERMMRAEFRLLQDVQLWRLSLSKRDERFTADSLRRFCEEVNKPLNPTIFAALARFYRNLMPSDFVLSKFDFVVTQLFAKKMEYNRRVLRVEPQKLVGHLSELNAEWTGIPANWSKESGKTREAVTEFLRFVTQIKTPQTLEEFLASDFFNRYRSFKRGLGDVFFSPEVTAAAVLSNVEVGNRFAELCETESAALNNAASMAFDYTQKSDVSAVDETSRTQDILQQLTGDKNENAVSPQITGFINQIQSNGNGSHHFDKNGANKEHLAPQSANVKTFDELPVEQNAVENVRDNAEDIPLIIEDSANENEFGSESDFDRLIYTENRFAENESKLESSIGDAEEELEWQLAMSEEIIAESANSAKSQETFLQESFETKVDAENPIAELESLADNITATDLSQNGNFEMVAADEIESVENSKVAAANVSILMERENLPPFADVLSELAKVQPNKNLINEYLSGSTSADLRTLELTDFLSVANAMRETTDGALRNRALRLLLKGEDIIRSFEANTENEEFAFNESDILTLLEEMQTVGNSLRLSMRELTGDDKKQRVDSILAAAKSLVETRLRLNSVVVRRNAKNEQKKRLIIDESGDVLTQSHNAPASQNAAPKRAQQTRETTTEKSKSAKIAKPSVAFKFDWWLIGLMAVVVIFVGGWFAFSSSTGEETPISKDVQTLNPQSLIGGEEIASAKVNKQMLICVVNDKWKTLTEDKKKENLRALMNYSKDNKFDAIIVMSKNGEVVANASAKEVKLEQ
ncbi:MAG: hypothetical protein H7Z37_00890 [Pyrinomonadaceae bacterium]|nr:hypothetical protein [Pyrinomonadaceae bacterium]